MNNENIKVRGKAQFPKLLTVSPTPHIHGNTSTREIMITVLIALLPALIWSVYIFGIRALLVVLLCVGVCVLSEFLFEKLLHRPITIGDFSAALTGVLFGMNLPVSIPYWAAAIGSAFAIIIVKQLFGGIGKNFLNPALAARAFMFSWPSLMTYFTAPFEKLGLWSVDAVATATPLADINSGITPAYSTFDMFLGKIPGCIGEVSSLLLLVGGIFLLTRKVITWHIPVSYIGTVALFAYLFPQGGLETTYVWYSLFSGGLFLGAIFMATDYVTSPITPTGKLIFGVGCGAVTVFIRYFGGYAEGVSFAILTMNLFVYYLDKFCRPRVFGKFKEKKKKTEAK